MHRYITQTHNSQKIAHPGYISRLSHAPTEPIPSHLPVNAGAEARGGTKSRRNMYCTTAHLKSIEEARPHALSLRVNYHLTCRGNRKSAQHPILSNSSTARSVAYEREHTYIPPLAAERYTRTSKMMLSKPAARKRRRVHGSVSALDACIGAQVGTTGLPPRRFVH